MDALSASSGGFPASPDRAARLSGERPTAARPCQTVPPQGRGAAPEPAGQPQGGRWQGPPAFDCLLLDAATPVQALLDEQGQQGDEVVLVQHPEALVRDSLTVRFTLDNRGRVRREPGRLFHHDRPLCLVLDCRGLSGTQLASWNDLLDSQGPCLHDGSSAARRPLGDHVRLLVLLSTAQWNTTDAEKADSIPGADFWNRVSRPGLTWEWREKRPAPLASTRLPAVHTGPVPQDDSIAVIDFVLQSDWRRTLLGAVGVDDNGRLCHHPGALEQLDNLPQTTQVVLRGADWSDPVFCHQWCKIQHTGVFESNGVLHPLRADVVFFRTELDAAQRLWLGQCVARQETPSCLSVVINRHNLDSWLALGGIDTEGRWCQGNALLERLADGAGLIVSSPLGEAGWLRLLGRLCSAGYGDERIDVFVAHDLPDEQDLVPALPPGSAAAGPVTGEAPLASLLASGVRIRHWHDSDQISAWLDLQQESLDGQRPLVIRVHAGTRLGTLFDNIHVVSDRHPLFSVEKTTLEQALESGRPVALCGLEKSPALQWQLESLVCEPPSVLVSGRWRCFPQAQLTVLWHAAVPSPAPLWSQLLTLAEPLPPVDLWDGFCRRWPQDAGQAVRLRQMLRGYLAAWHSVPPTLAAQAGPAPELTASLLDSLMAAARQQALAESCKEVAAHHWRRALDSVLSHRSRGCPPVHQFLKTVSARLVPDPGPGQWVDPERLAELFASQGGPESERLDLAFLQPRLWSLLRALGPELLPALPLRFDATPVPRDMTVLVAILRIWGPDGCGSVQVPPELAPSATLLGQVQHLPVRSARRLRRLRDALATGWRWRRRGALTPLYPSLTTLAAACCRLDAQSQTTMEKRVAGILEWTGAQQHKSDAFRTLIEDLLRGHSHQAERDKRRQARLRERLELAPVVMIEGPTATGKSHYAAQVAREAGPAYGVSVGPGTTEDDLAQRWVWQDLGQERTMVACDLVLLQWAHRLPESADQLVTLVLDEANLMEPGGLDCFKGLWEWPPCVYVGGQAVPVSSQHRVILTCNPVSDIGRHQNPDLARWALRMHYRPMDSDFLCQQLVRPALDRHLARWVGPARLQETADRLMQLWQACQSLLPGRTFTPRDLEDMCAWLGWYAAHGRTPLSAASLYALLLQALRDLLEQDCNADERCALQALAVWYGTRWSAASELPVGFGDTRTAVLDNHFVLHARRLAADFDTSLPAVMTLASAINRDLDRCDQARRGHLAPGRRQATLIEGPSGRGKDASLRLLLDSWQQLLRDEGQPVMPVRFLCAADCPWDLLSAAFRSARTAGEVLVISELNLCESRWLEGELNAALAGEAAPGFHLLATINPPGSDCRGRQPLSAALLGRFRRLLVPDYSPQELRSIAGRALAVAGQDNARLADRISHWHGQLSRLLEARGLALRPVSQQLVQLARACGQCPAADAGSLFDSHYRLYLLAAATDRTALEALSATSSAQDVPDEALTQWVNGCDWPSKPVTVWRGPVTALDWKKGRLVLQARGLPESQETERIMDLLIRARWKEETGLSVQQDVAWDIERLLYRLWQQLWCQQCLRLDAATARRLFPLPPNKAQMLDTVRYRSGQDELQELCSQWPDQPWRWRLLWQRIRALSQPGLADARDHERAIRQAAVETQAAPGKEVSLAASPPAQDAHLRQLQELANGCVELLSLFGTGGLSVLRRLWNEADARTQSAVGTHSEQPNAGHREWLVRATDLANQPVPRLQRLDAFGSAHRDALTRLDILDPVVQGDRLLIPRRPAGRRGFEMVSPGKLPAAGCLKLTADQYYGACSLPDLAGWQALPGRYPDEQLIRLRTQPQRMALVRRDCETGMHFVRFLDASRRSRTGIVVHYVLAAPPPRAKRKAEPRQDRPPHPDALCEPAMLRRLQVLLTDQQWGRLPLPTALALEAIVQAPTDGKRLAAIVRYCQDFGCNKAPDEDEDLLEFLLRERQGGCTHRAFVCVLLCRCWGIAARMVLGHGHTFVEHSLDGGHSWTVCDPGGAPVDKQPGSPLSCQPYQRAVLSDNNVYRSVCRLDAADRRLLARSLGLPPEAVDQLAHQAVVSAVSEPLLQEEQLLLRLLNCRTLSTFVLACRLLTGMDKPTEATWLQVANQRTAFSMLGSYAAFHCSQSHKAQREIRIQLLALQAWIRQQARPAHWRCLLRVLAISLKMQPCDKHCPSDSDSLRQAMLDWLLEQHGWQPEPQSYYHCDNVAHYLLEQLSMEAATRSAALRQLQGWYRIWLHAGWRLDLSQQALLDNLDCTGFANWQPSCYGGSLPALERALRQPVTGRVWTDQPEGVPDPERLLAGLPAFAVTGAGVGCGRDLIVLAPPRWHDPGLQEAGMGLMDRALPGLRSSPELRQSAEHLLNRSFCFCLYELVRLAQGRLHVQLAWHSTDDGRSSCTGLCPVDSLRELAALFAAVPTGHRALPLLANDKDCVRTACHKPEAHVLDSDDLTRLALEFFGSVDTALLRKALAGLLE